MNQHASAPLGIALALIAMPGAGCVAGGADSPVVPLPAPGDTYSFIGSDGTWLNVSVAGPTLRPDAFLHEVTTLVLQWTYDHPRDGIPASAFEEAVEPGSGSIVHQIALCGAHVRVEGAWQCVDERALAVYAAAGLPGGFGLGPAWGRHLTQREFLEFQVSNPILGEFAARYRVSATDGAGPGCVRLEAGPFDLTGFRGLNTTVLAGPLVACHGLALPFAFTTVSGVEFTMVAHAGAQAALAPRDADPAAEPAPLKARKVSAPLLVADGTDPWPFSVEEAHAEAMGQSAAYASLFAHGDGLLIGTHVRIASEANALGVLQVRTYVRDLTAVSQDGRFVKVSLSKVVHDPALPGERATLEAEEQGEIDVFPSVGSFARNQTQLAPAIRRIETLTNSTLGGSGYGLRHAVPAHPLFAGNATPRADGFTIVVWASDPVPDGNLGPNIEVPYSGAIDGPTGALLWFNYVRTDPPWERAHKEPRATQGDGSSIAETLMAARPIAAR